MMNKKLISMLAVCALLCLSCGDKDDDNSCDESYIPECVDSSHYQSCKDGEIVQTTCDADKHCVKKNNAVSCEVTCSHDTPICLDANNLETCVDKTSSVKHCPYGCSDGKCQDPVKECLTAGEKRCNPTKPKYVQTCKNDVWVDDTRACDYSCKEGACAPKCETQCTDEHTVSITCPDADTYGVTCAFSCENGKCLDLAVPEAGQNCKENSFPDKCVGNILAYCNGDTVSEVYCSGESSCQTSTILNGYSECTKACNTAGATKNQCLKDVEDTGYYVIQSACEEINGQNHQFNKVIDYCYTGCNEDNTGCAFANECTGYSDHCDTCDPALDKPSCAPDGSYTIFCYEDGSWTGDACPEGTQCFATKNDAECLEPCDSSQLGQEKTKCGTTSILSYVYYYSQTSKCTEIKNGIYAWVADDNKSEVCNSTCNEETGLCKKLVENEGEECDANTKGTCNGAIATFCAVTEQGAAKGKITAIDCHDYAGDDFVCGFKDGNLTCVEPCSIAGDTKSSCEMIDEEAFIFGSVDLVCKNDKENGLIWVTDKTNYSCSDYCSDENPDECAKYVEDEYTPCDETFTERCENGVAVYCEFEDGAKTGVVTTLNCEGYDYACAMVDDIAHCLKPCNVEDMLTSSCDSYTNQQFTSICTRFDDGRFLNVGIQSATVDCKKGCNKAGTACK